MPTALIALLTLCLGQMSQVPEHLRPSVALLAQDGGAAAESLEAIVRAEARLGRPAQDREIADELGLSLDDYQRLAAELACARMTPIEDSVEAAQAEADAANPYEQVGAAGSRAALAQAIERLPERERLMMSLYYTEDLNLREIGAVLGVSESRVSQLHGQALARLRNALTAWRA